MKAIRILAVSSYLLVICADIAAAEVVVRSGNDLRKACQSVLDSGPARNALDAAFCLGFVRAAWELGPILEEHHKFCAPQNASLGQAIRVVAKYLDANPEITNRQAIVLTVAAFKSAWPCG